MKGMKEMPRLETLQAKEDTLVSFALACGAAKAETVSIDRVVLSPVFRDICETNACGNYGQCYMCPPDVGDIQALMDRVRAFSFGLLYQTISPLEDSFDFEGMAAAGEAHVQVSQRMQEKLASLLPGGFLHLTCGGCRLCKVCARREGKPCVHPDRALPSLESYGIDVYNTAKGTGLLYVNGKDTVTYFGIVLFEPDEDA